MASSDSSSDRRPRKRRHKRSSKHRSDSRSNSSIENSSYERKRSRRKKEKKRRRRRDDDDSDEPKRKKSHKKRRKKECGAGDNIHEDARNGLKVRAAEKVNNCASDETSAAHLPNSVDASETKDAKKPATSKGPMTQAQYQELYSQIHEVIDPHTGRTRWQRGTGEIVERIVSREEHLSLNACATRGDGASFGKDIVRAASRK
eukprot:scaffold28065_cov68-Cyclotella_meneghiniana.AAC.4